MLVSILFIAAVIAVVAAQIWEQTIENAETKRVRDEDQAIRIANSK